jgi:hypothetical protein
MVIRMVIQTIKLHPAGPDQIDAAPYVSRDDPTPWDVSDCEPPPRNRKIAGYGPRVQPAGHSYPRLSCRIMPLWLLP